MGGNICKSKIRLWINAQNIQVTQQQKRKIKKEPILWIETFSKKT